MKVDTLYWLIDVQPVYSALIELTNDAGMYPPPVKAFLRFKLKEEVLRLRQTARHIEKRLNEFDERTASEVAAKALPRKKGKKGKKHLKKVLEYRNEGPSRADSSVYLPKKPG